MLSLSLSLGIVEIDVAGVAVAIVVGDFIDSGPMSDVGVRVEGGDDCRVVEAVALDFDG